MLKLETRTLNPLLALNNRKYKSSHGGVDGASFRANYERAVCSRLIPPHLRFLMGPLPPLPLCLPSLGLLRDPHTLLIIILQLSRNLVVLISFSLLILYSKVNIFRLISLYFSYALMIESGFYHLVLEPSFLATYDHMSPKQPHRFTRNTFRFYDGGLDHLADKFHCKTNHHKRCPRLPILVTKDLAFHKKPIDSNDTFCTSPSTHLPLPSPPTIFIYILLRPSHFSIPVPT